jgi:hypothetical protein
VARGERGLIPVPAAVESSRMLHSGLIVAGAVNAGSG